MADSPRKRKAGKKASRTQKARPPAGEPPARAPRRTTSRNGRDEAHAILPAAPRPRRGTPPGPAPDGHPRSDGQVSPPRRRGTELERTARAPAAEPGPQDVAAAPRSPREDRSGKYVYCIIQSTRPASFGPIGIGAEPTEVHTVGYEDIAAVVSDTPIEVYDPTRENVLAHERVNETVMHRHTVIPMSFGTVFKTGDDIVELLRSAYGAFRDVLQKMENKLEFGLKVLWDPDEIIRAVEQEDESLRRLREEILKQRGSTYFARMQYGRLVDSLLQERSEYYVREIFETLRPVVVASRANKPIGERMIMNAAFLVSRDQEQEFDAKVKAIGGRHSQLTFKYTGPWPPYNFVNIRLKLERARDSQ